MSSNDNNDSEHNIDKQCGNEGEKANESGGTLNPALLSFSTNSKTGDLK
jgi:hypothetical protein